MAYSQDALLALTACIVCVLWVFGALYNGVSGHYHIAGVTSIWSCPSSPFPADTTSQQKVTLLKGRRNGDKHFFLEKSCPGPMRACTLVSSDNQRVSENSGVEFSKCVLASSPKAQHKPSSCRKSTCPWFSICSAGNGYDHDPRGLLVYFHGSALPSTHSWRPAPATLAAAPATSHHASIPSWQQPAVASFPQDAFGG
ncbi:uncharacterized protein AAG666_014756 isoform 1-T3 [Megaptera novaeangliae]